MSCDSSYQFTCDSSYQFTCKDRISHLPDILTSHILSRLPTKEAIQTCVLSKDWKYKWTSINNIDITDSNALTVSIENEAVFFDFMEKMSLLSLSHNVRIFYLKCRGYYDSNRMSAWIAAVLGPKLEAFRVLYAWEGLVLPPGLLNCNSLKTLELNSQVTFKIPAAHTFPNLVHLHLNCVDIINEDSVTFIIVLKFPALKVLKMRRCKWFNVKIVEICAPSLTELRSETHHRQDNETVNNYLFKIIGARLSQFKTRLGLHENFILTGSEVDHVAFYSATGYKHDSIFYTEFGLQVRKLLKELWSMNYLVISHITAEAIAQPNPGLCLPRYDKLERLEIHYHVGRHNSLLEVLHAAPNLKILQVELMTLVGDGDHDIDVWSVPSCIVSSMEEFKIIIRSASKYELHIVKFMMEKGKDLKKIYLLFCGDGPNAPKACSYLDQLSSFPKASEHLKVVVDYAFGSVSRFG